MRIKFCILFFFIYILISFACAAQDSAYIHFLLERIAQQQVKQDEFFLPGIFPSYISNNEKFSERRKDNNIFYNGLIAYTLNEIRPFSGKEDQLLIDSILDNSKLLFKNFQNKTGRNTYNFWRTDSPYKYPYSFALPFFTKKITLPDDMDDTVLSLFALDTDDSTAKEVHALMQHYTNNDSNKVRSVISAYKNLPAYSTWFGKKFPVVFDVSVLCNILTFVETYNLQWTKADSASLDVIIKTIQNNYHITQPMYVSPYYPKTSLILYHIARLMSVKITELEDLKGKLLSDAETELVHSDNTLEKIILATTILKLGYSPSAFELPTMNGIESKIEKNNFSFFVGNVPSYFRDALRKYATRNNIWLFYHYCPAWNDALLLEYLVLKNK
jgi:hypothetical protein